jgi:transposase-like protein
MSRVKSSHRVFSREFKIGIVGRILAGENVSALARELKFGRKDLYVWRDRFLAGGPQALRGRGRPGKAAAPVSAAAAATAPGEPGDALAVAQRRIADLERKVGQQQLELDFFRQALRQAGGSRQPSTGLGVRASTKSSER